MVMTATFTTTFLSTGNNTGIEVPEMVIDGFWWCRRPWAQPGGTVLRYYEDLPLTEIAEILDRPAATIRSDLRRALIRRLA